MFYRGRHHDQKCAAAAVFAMGLWIRFDKDMDEYVNSLGMYFYWNGTTVLMVGATLVMITSFMACCGAYFKNVPMLIAVSKI